MTILTDPQSIELYQMHVILHLLEDRYHIHHPNKKARAAATARTKFGCTGRLHAKLARQMRLKIAAREAELVASKR